MTQTTIKLQETVTQFLGEIFGAKPEDVASMRLHEKLVRHSKGMVSAWEEWLREKKTT